MSDYPEGDECGRCGNQRTACTCSLEAERDNDTLREQVAKLREACEAACAEYFRKPGDTPLGSSRYRMPEVETMNTMQAALAETKEPDDEDQRNPVAEP